MKLPLNIPRARVAGFTLVEIYIVSTLLLLLVLAMTATQFFGARVYTLAATKLTATASGRKAMNDIREQVRGASRGRGHLRPRHSNLHQHPHRLAANRERAVDLLQQPQRQRNTMGHHLFHEPAVQQHLQRDSSPTTRHCRQRWSATSSSISPIIMSLTPKMPIPTS